MENKKKIHVFAHADLDGAACYLVLHWYLWNRPTYTITTHYNLRNDVSKWLLKNNPENYDEIYFVALDTCEVADLIDFPNVHILDHHQEANRCKELYKKANFNILELGSTVLGLYRYLKAKYSERKISAQQRKFVALVDDYVSYRLLERDLSIGLNMLYWNYQGDKIEKLSNDFNIGFEKFDDKQLTIIDFYKRKIDKIINEAEFYTGDFKIQGVFRKVISTFANTCINEVAAELTKLGYEIAIVVNTDTQKVSLRKNHYSNVNLPELAKKLCGGGGYKNTAGGLITKEFLAFTKLLERHDIRTRK